MTPDQLKDRLRQLRDTLPESYAVRLHRAISWLQCAEAQGENADLQFVSLWIAFNACYGIDEESLRDLPERNLFQRFVDKLVRHDQDKAIYNCLWQTYSGPVRTLIDNRFVYAPFWEAQRRLCSGEVDTTQWESQFSASAQRANKHLATQNVSGLLQVVLDRLYVLRNQIMHGGATWQSQVNRQQVKDGCRILTTLMPIIVGILMEASDEDWGEIYYPVVR